VIVALPHGRGFAQALVVLALAAAVSACVTGSKKDTPPQAAKDSPEQTQPHAPKHAGTKHGDSDTPKQSPYAPAQEDPSKRGDYVAGGLYAPQIKDSVPDYVPNVEAIPEPEVKAERPSRYGNRSYAVLGKSYRVLASSEGYVEQGNASYYGNKFHGRLTSNQEVYDMYAFTAAHRSLPLPSYVRVTNLSNGKSVVVRVNDRGPFHANRIIDLSYAAAVKLDFIRQGTARVEVEALQPGERGSRTTAARRERKDRETSSAALVPKAPAAAASTPAAPPDPAVAADEFDRWMRDRDVRIATGKPSDASPTTAASTKQTPEGGGPKAEDAPPANATVAATADAGVSLQVAAFSSLENAERGQQRLRDAGLPAVRIDETQAGGKPLWRLRIGPVAADRVQELSARCADLGFDAVKIVRE
jgi:rare lipoprotein A